MAASLSFIVGVIGNIISLLVFTSPIKTFSRVVKKKSTENYKGIPYVTTLLSTSLWTFYGLMKPGGLLVATVNGAGTVLQFIYVTLFLVYAPKDKKIKTAKLVAMLNIGFLGSVIALTLLAIRENVKLTFVGILCSGLTIGMYASPLSVMGMVIKMQSVEYMPFLLSFFLFLNAGIWSIYSLIVKDFFIGVPNAIGFVLGSAQLIIYSIYKNKSKPKKSIGTLEEEGSATLVKGVVEMGAYDDNGDEEGGGGGGGNVKISNKSLNKGHSLPKSFLKRIYSMPQQIVKSLSLNNSYQIDSTWVYPDDVENKENDDHLLS